MDTLIGSLFGAIGGILATVVFFAIKGLEVAEAGYEKAAGIPLIGNWIRKKMDKKIDSFLDSVFPDTKVEDGVVDTQPLRKERQLNKETKQRIKHKRGFALRKRGN